MENNSTNAELVKQTLNTKLPGRCEIFHVKNAQAAISEAEKGVQFAILMLTTTPNYPGGSAGLARDLKTRLNGSNPAAVSISAYDKEYIRQGIEPDPFDVYVMTPYDTTQFAALVDRMLSLS